MCFTFWDVEFDGDILFFRFEPRKDQDYFKLGQIPIFKIFLQKYCHLVQFYFRILHKYLYFHVPQINDKTAFKNDVLHGFVNDNPHNTGPLYITQVAAYHMQSQPYPFSQRPIGVAARQETASTIGTERQPKQWIWLALWQNSLP